MKPVILKVGIIQSSVFRVLRSRINEIEIKYFLIRSDEQAAGEAVKDLLKKLKVKYTTKRVIYMDTILVKDEEMLKQINA